MNVWETEFGHKTFPNPGVSAVKLCASCVKPVRPGERAEVRLTHEHLNCAVFSLIKRHDCTGVELNNADKILLRYLCDSVQKYLRRMSDGAQEWGLFLVGEEYGHRETFQT